MSFAQQYLAIKPGTDLSDFVHMTLEHADVTYLLFKDDSALVTSAGKQTIEAKHPVAAAYNAALSGQTLELPLGSAESVAYEAGTRVRAANSPEAQAHRANLLKGIVTTSKG